MSNDFGRDAANVDRREFLRLGGAGMLLSVLPIRFANGATGEEVTFAAEGFALTLDIPDRGAAQVRALRNATTRFEWCRAGSPLEPVLVTGATAQRGWTSRRGAGGSVDTGKRYEFSAQHAASGVEARWALQGFTDAPVVEFRTEFRTAPRRALPAVTAFGPLRLALRHDLGRLQVHGVQRESYDLVTQPVPGEDAEPDARQLSIKGGEWNEPGHGGLIVLEAVDTQEFLFVGIEWERGWRYRLDREQDALWLTVEVADLTHDMAPGERLSTPRVFVGLAHGDLDTACITAQHYLKRHVLLAPLEQWPWVVYNFWGTEAQGVEDAMLREVEFAAKLGVELFYQDASWWEGSSKKGDGNWFPGVGNYVEDREKYPGGLAAVSRKVHEAGMKFGLWVGPNVVDSGFVGNRIPQKWIAQIDGKDAQLSGDSGSSVHQVCLGCLEYVEFLKTQLADAVERYRLDWLKWDNSGIPGSPAACNRADHGHQAGDGSYAALRGEYEVFEHLHAKFPKLVLEQCGYGSRVDYGRARTIRANWLDDSTDAGTVLHNATAASYLFPSHYNGGWVIKPEEGDDAQLDAAFRSRMLGQFGFGTLTGRVTERVSMYPEPMLAAARRNIPLYKRYRHLLGQDCYHLLPSAQNDQWLAVQFVTPRGDEAVVLMFRRGSAEAQKTAPVRALDTNLMYEVTFANTGAVSKVGGMELLRDGITVSLAQPGTSEIVLIKAT